jgi:hypothetical protein
MKTVCNFYDDVAIVQQTTSKGRSSRCCLAEAALRGTQRNRQDAAARMDRGCRGSTRRLSAGSDDLQRPESSL